MNSDLHWRYLKALDDDFSCITRYVEPTKDNLTTYSIENARTLMMATQECDVLLKALCKSISGEEVRNEQGYRKDLMKNCSSIASISVILPVYSIDVVPFEDWLNGETPKRWTANNKVKHNRDTHFDRATLLNVISSISGVLVALLYNCRDHDGITDMKVGLQHFKPVLKTHTTYMATDRKTYKLEN